MKYIRTKDGRIIKVREGFEGKEWKNSDEYFYSHYHSKADTIEELCDEFVVKERVIVYDNPFEKLDYIKKVKMYKHKIIYGAIWTDKGLIYVAKMNEKGELELL